MIVYVDDEKVADLSLQNGAESVGSGSKEAPLFLGGVNGTRVRADGPVSREPFIGCISEIFLDYE